jgi:sporulation protein YlmC with PRC-barrel domain
VTKAALAAILAAAVAMPALAQTNPPAPPPPSTSPSPTTAAPASGGSTQGGMQMSGQGTGMTTAKTSTATVHFITVKPTDATASRLLGVNVYNNQNENLGEIDDFVINDGKTISAVVIGVGGFLGMGEHYVAVEPSSIILHKDNNTWKAMLNTSKDDLKKAPTFDYSKKKS